MIKKGMGYFVGLVGLYLVVNNYTGSGKVITDGANGFATITHSLQGR